jgi:hypothetical protein
MKEERIKEVERETERKRDERNERVFEERRKKNKARAEERMANKQEMHINLISAVEMKAYTKEMRAENDRKFVRCLMEQGLSKLEAIKRVNVWSNEWDSVRNG